MRGVVRLKAGDDVAIQSPQDSPIDSGLLPPSLLRNYGGQVAPKRGLAMTTLFSTFVFMPPTRLGSYDN
ncbi:MAG: hypothetical protein ABTQ34_03840 [Bdellovibrionales bacterium]